jgi:type VI secretion system protein ImpG
MPLPPGLPETGAARIPPQAAYVLRLRIAVDAPGVNLGTLKMRSLRLHLRAAEHAVPQIYSLLRESFGAHVYTAGNEEKNAGGEDGAETLAGAARVLPVGFDPDDGMVPYALPTPWGYRMAADYFSFPEKFHFFDLDGLPSVGAAREMIVRVFCPTPPADLEVSKENFLTGCVPAVNLFDRDLHVSMNHETPEYRLAVPPDAGAGARVYSVNRVAAAPSGGGKSFDIEPFYPFAPAADGRVFHLERRRGEETYLSFTDLRRGGERWETAQVSVSATCCHGADAAPLPADAVFRLRERQTVVEGVSVVSGPTRCVFPPGGREAHWRLMSHIALNHLSLSGGAEGAAALTEMLRLYDWSADADNGSRIAAIRSVESRRRLLRPAEGGEDLADCFLGGLEVEVALRDDRAGDALFASVLEAFVSGYAALNTPVRVCVRSEQRGGREWRFPLRMGKRRLI